MRDKQRAPYKPDDLRPAATPGAAETNPDPAAKPVAAVEPEPVAHHVAMVGLVAEPAPSAPEPPKLGKDLAQAMKATINDLHHYGIISDAEAVSLKERIDAKS